MFWADDIKTEVLVRLMTQDLIEFNLCKKVEGRIAGLSHERLSSIIVKDWYWEKLDLFSQFLHLKDIELYNLAENLVLKSINFPSLDLNLEVVPKCINLKDCQHVDGLTVDVEDKSMTSNLYLPRTIDYLSVRGRSFFDGLVLWAQRVPF